MMNLLRDTRFGFRLLVKNPGFAAVAILALALGIGANTAIFSVVYATLLAPLPYPHPDQLVVVWSHVHGNRNVSSAGDFLEWQRENSVFQSMGTATGSNFNLSTGETARAQSAAASPLPDFWTKVLGESPFLGPLFSVPKKPWPAKITSSFSPTDVAGTFRQRPAHHRPRNPHEWRNLHRHRSASPRASRPHRQRKLFVPLVFKPEQINHDFHWLVMFARMKPGVTLAQANADMDAVTRHIADVYPKSNKGWGATVEPLKNDFLDRDVRTALWLLARRRWLSCC